MADFNAEKEIAVLKNTIENIVEQISELSSKLNENITKIYKRIDGNGNPAGCLTKRVSDLEGDMKSVKDQNKIQTKLIVATLFCVLGLLSSGIFAIVSFL